ncbi:cbb3-type cytochrome c oxidase subunit I [Pontibacter sp. KCTC 32443]|uniref:cbb3-type cytochrome c oxidase subunit I n=1 Tax=Pontibacter TaxID=323449 RepID=UPI00164E87A7|nr:MULTISPECIES: cbb3-type cytochrome c oxidase subunit I [Pontibacter]MBC5774730.1 cbb3-type cytochrome c oxidase subunit I [Pontibacter sp. KCTC 32443]
MNRSIGFLSIATGLCFLVAGILFGSLGGIFYLFPQELRDLLPFTKLRPLHVSSVIFWILFTAIGGLYLYLPKHKTRLANKLGLGQYLLLLTAAVAIPGCYIAGIFGGREYWEYPPILGLLIAASFILLGINFYKSIRHKPAKEPWPVYRWMWLSGIVFFILSFAESYLWLLPYFKQNLVRDMAVQWKSYGSLVGSWNMLINGSALFVMEKISGDKTTARKPLTFFMFFLGLFNLMFNWGHHIYNLPVSNIIRYTAYLVSMTELLILAKIIWNWRSSLSQAQKYKHILSYRFFTAADIWILLNLVMAILMSVPAINLYSHGTHITVAHAMGTTIGINTMLLLASVCYACSRFFGDFSQPKLKLLNRGLYLSNASLLIFWVALIGAGIGKAILQTDNPDLPHAILMQQLIPWFIGFAMSGLGVATGIVLMVWPLLTTILKLKKLPHPEQPQRHLQPL